MKEMTPRLDLQVGNVPDYRTFVRRLWTYRDADGFQVCPPPVMYRAIFQQEDPDLKTIERIAEYASSCGVGRAIRWELIVTRGELMGAWELQFYSLRALHTFCVVLGDRARVQGDDVAIRVGEFIMWTLGFRWV